MPQTEQYEALPEGEHLVMRMARETGIATVPHALMRMSEAGGEPYIRMCGDSMLPDLVNYPDLRLTPKRSELVTALWYSGYLLPHFVDWHHCQKWRYIKAR